jgi:multidrug efflux system membrane fusion protein
VFRHTLRTNPILAIIFTLSMALLVSCSKTGAHPPKGQMMMPEVAVRALPAVSAAVPQELSAVGNVEAVSTVDVKSRVAGQLLHVYFTEGQDVREGQPLFEIDPEPLQRQLAQIEADLAKDSALIKQAQANVSKDEANVKQSRAQADRGLQLSKDGIFSKEQTEQVTATADSAQASLEADRAAVESAQASIKSDQARLAQTSLQLSYTKISAPISGRAGAISVKPGNLVKENDTTLVTLLQVSPIYVSFGVPEQFLSEIRKFNQGHPLTVTASTGQGTATGTLHFIDNSVDSTTGTIKLKAQFANRERTLWPGQFVTVQTRLQMEQDRILVPSRAVLSGPDGKYVWVMDPSKKTVAMRPVTVLRNYQEAKAGEQAVISQGLHSGEVVISEGQMGLMPGAKVRLLQPANLQSSNQPSPDNTGGA